jgi:seryl-tRNA synthetase
MLNVRDIVENREVYINGLNKRNKDFTNEINEICELYTLYLKELKIIEDAKAQVNEKSKLIGVYKREQKDTTELMDEINNVKKLCDDVRAKELFTAYNNILMTLPNVPNVDVPVGIDEEDNVVVKTYGTPRKFDFTPRAHHEIGEIIDGLDFERASKISKSRFVITKGFVAKLERAITNYMLDTHESRGYLEFGVPVVVNEDTLLASGQLPKFADDLFKIQRSNETDDDEFAQNVRDYYLIPTAEVVLANLHRDEFVDLSAGNLNFMAYTQCFRKEAGSAGKDTRGMMRVHQFGKVELFKYTTEETSYQELDNMVSDAEAILQGLELPYRLMSLCTGDMGSNAAKTFDLEVWVPSQEKYRECSSCSNVVDFQGRRGRVRYKDQDGTTKFVHMLNGSGMATGRILLAVMENYQNEDGSITIPDVLKKYMER